MNQRPLAPQRRGLFAWNRGTRSGVNHVRSAPRQGASMIKNLSEREHPWRLAHWAPFPCGTPRIRERFSYASKGARVIAGRRLVPTSPVGRVGARFNWRRDYSQLTFCTMILCRSAGLTTRNSSSKGNCAERAGLNRQYQSSAASRSTTNDADADPAPSRSCRVGAPPSWPNRRALQETREDRLAWPVALAAFRDVLRQMPEAQAAVGAIIAF